jgi:uncharacterized protein GlcG (DUF336 family)
MLIGKSGNVGQKFTGPDVFLCRRLHRDFFPVSYPLFEPEERVMPGNDMLMEKPALTLAAAKKIIAAAEAEALKQGWPVVIAVVDDGGHLICLQRLDGAQFASVEVAIRKANAAIAFKRPTREWEKMLNDGQQRVLNLPGVLASEGGVPLTWKGHIVGAIGVSGVKPSEDGQVARSGAAVLG